MIRFNLDRRAIVGCALLAASATLLGCGASDTPQTDAARAQRGREIIQRMSAAISSAPQFSITTNEGRDDIAAGGQVRHTNLTRETVVRRPDRLYFTTTGEARREGWYDGVGLTVAEHAQKVFAQSRMPETLDKTIDAIHERYGVILPLADLLYADPAKAILTDSTTGGWVGREELDGRKADHVAFKVESVAWEMWVPADGPPLPLKLVAEFATQKRPRKVEVTFQNWNLAPTIAADQFNPKVPPDYEGIAMIQRASILRHLPDEPAATSGKR